MSGDRRIFIVALAAILSFGSASGALFQSGQGGSRSRRDGNAAEVYRQAFGLLEGRVPKGMTSEEYDELIQLTELGRISPIDVDRVRELMSKAKPFMDAVGPAGSMRKSDFGLDRSKGFELTLDHLGPMRSTARLLRAQAALAYVDSDWETALSTLRSWSALSGHVGQDDIMISSLVGNAIGRVSLPSIDVLLDDGTLTQEKAKALAEALRPLRGGDPFNFGQSVRGEFQLLSSEISNKRGEELATLLNGLGMDGSAVANMSERDLRRSVERARDIYSRAALAFENPDPDAARRAIAELEREAEQNPVLKVLIPSFSRALETKLETAEEIAARLERLDAIADGTKRAIDVANASTWLRRAAAIAAAMPDEAQEAVEVVRFAGPSADAMLLDRATRVFLGAGRAIREAIERALLCGTLDLDAPNDGDFGLSMRWLPGLRGASRTLLAEATTLESQSAADRALLVAGVGRALVRDPSVTRSLVARSIIEEAVPLFERVAGDPGVRAESRQELLKMLRELAASEGFRMAKGLEFDRDRLSTGSPWGRVIDPARRKHVARRGPEFALFLQVAVVPPDRWAALPDPSASRKPAPPPSATTPAAAPSSSAPSGTPAPPAPSTTPPATPSTTPSSTPATTAAPTPGVLIRFDDLLPPEPTAQARALHEKIASNQFFTLIRTVTDSDAEEKFPFRGLTPVVIRNYGTDLASAAEIAAKLSAIADRLEK